MRVFGSRDSNYKDEEHDRARIFLSALLVKEDPDVIYKWAKNCSKSEFYKKINEAVGDEIRDIGLDGLSAFAKRHLPGVYVQTLLKNRTENDLKKVKENLKIALLKTPKKHVFHDNLQWQILFTDHSLDEHTKVISGARELWPLLKSTSFANPVARLAYLSSCVKGSHADRTLWQSRVHTNPETKVAEVDWEIIRIGVLVENDLITVEKALLKLKQIRQKKDFVNDPYFYAVFKLTITSMIKGMLKLYAFRFLPWIFPPCLQLLLPCNLLLRILQRLCCPTRHTLIPGTC